VNKEREVIIPYSALRKLAYDSFTLKLLNIPRLESLGLFEDIFGEDFSFPSEKEVDLEISQYVRLEDD